MRSALPFWAEVYGHDVEVNAVGEEENSGTGVVKLPAVVGLDGLDAGAELGRDIGKKVR